MASHGAGRRGALEHQLGQRLRHDLAGRVVGRAEEHQLGRVAIEQRDEVAGHALRIGHRPVGPGRRVEHRQPDDLHARRHERQLAFVVGVGRVEQHHRVARIDQRPEQVVGELGAAQADGDVLRAEPRHAEEMRLEAGDLLAAGEVAERGGVGAALVEEVRGRRRSPGRPARNASGAAWFTQPPPNEMTSSGSRPIARMFWRSAIFMIWRMGEGEPSCAWTSADSGRVVVGAIAMNSSPA